MSDNIQNIDCGGFTYDDPQDMGQANFVPVIKLSMDDLTREVTDPDFHYVGIANTLIIDSVGGNKDETHLLENQIPSKIDHLISACPICKIKFDNEEKNETVTSFKSNLSNYLDKDKNNPTKIYLALHRRSSIDKGNITLTFDVKQGSVDAEVTSGYIRAGICPSGKGVNIVGDKIFNTAYDDKITLEIEVKLDENKTYEDEIFDINFLAYNNEEGVEPTSDNEFKNLIHCGQFGIISRNCICVDWKTIDSVIPSSDFVGWGANGSYNCNVLARSQLSKAGYTPGGGTIQLYTDVNSDQINDIPKKTANSRFVTAVKYIKEALNADQPVFVGIDNESGHPGNHDSTTDHFFVIVGSGNDDSGCYFTFYDNASNQASVGMSANNKVYCDCLNSILFVNKSANTYTSATSHYAKQIITQVRKNK